MLKIFCSPARYVQGREATRQLAAELVNVGITGRAFILASRSARRAVEPIWQETFGMHGLSFDVLDFGGECSMAEIQRGKDEAQRKKANCIIGAGGGKVLDTARAIAADLGLPVVCCPSTAASDAPCSALSVVYTPDGSFEKYLTYKRNPELVLVDTSVISRAPVRTLISGMGDALATWFEADACSRAHKANGLGGGATLAALAIAELCYKTLVQDGVAAVAAAQTGAVSPALERIVEANTLLSGLGFESAGLAAAHSIHNGLTAARETHAYMHGEKVAFGTCVQLILEGRSTREIDEVFAFCSSVGLPITLKQIGIERLSADKAREIAEAATAVGETIHNLPFAVSWVAVRDAIFAADSYGQAYQARNGADISKNKH